MKRKLPSIKPHQLGLMIHEASGRVLIVLKKPNDTIALKDVTTDFTLMLAAGILKEEAKGIVQEFVATDTYGNELTLQLTAEIISERRVHSHDASDI
jgi:hypothetical protein